GRRWLGGPPSARTPRQGSESRSHNRANLWNRPVLLASTRPAASPPGCASATLPPIKQDGAKEINGDYTIHPRRAMNDAITALQLACPRCSVALSPEIVGALRLHRCGSCD